VRSGRHALGDLVTRVRTPADPAALPGLVAGLEHLVAGQLRLELPPDAPSLREAHRFRAGDVLFGALRPRFRKVVLARDDGACSPEILVLRPRSGVDPGLALAVLSHPDTIAQAVSLGRGTRMPRVRWEDLARVERHLPDPHEAGRLGAFVRGVDDLLDLLHRRDRAEARLLLRAVGATRDGEGPRLGQVVAPLPATVLATSIASGTPVWSVADLPRGHLAVHRSGTDPGRSRKRPAPAGALLVPRLRPALRKAGVAPTDGVVSPEILVLVPRPPWGPVVAARLLDPTVQDRLVAAASGTRMPRIPHQVLWELPLGVSADRARSLHRALAPLLERALDDVHRAAAWRRLRDRVARAVLDEGASAPSPPASIGGSAPRGRVTAAPHAPEGA
jgi:hypothetical protein